MAAETITAPPPLVSAPLVPRDFPTWLPPMLVKELRQGLRTRGFVGTLVVFQLVMVILMLFALSTQSATAAGARATGAALAAGIFWAVLSVQMLIITPSRALGALQQEADTRTLDLLVLTRLNAWRIVLGKWISLLAQAVLLLVAMLPYLIIRYFTDNADLVAELGRCVLMLGLCAVMTAAGLWGSGVARLVRVLLAVAMGVLMVNLIGVFGPLLSGRSGAGGRTFLSGMFELPFDFLNGAVIASFFLVCAVRNIAPPAENHSLFTRVLALLMLMPAPLAEAAGAHALAARQLAIAGVFLAGVLLMELGGARQPMASQWRDWHRRGWLGRMIGCCGLPGWPSAFRFGLIAVGVWIAIAVIVMPLRGAWPKSALGTAWLALLAFSGFVFPAALQQLLRAVPVPPTLLYFFGLGLPAILSGVALWLAESRLKITAMKAVMEWLPFSSFLFGLDGRERPAPVMFLQGAVVAMVLGFAWWQGRAYWRRLQEFEAADRAEAAKKTAGA